jgi:hypothetical protein
MGSKPPTQFKFSPLRAALEQAFDATWHSYRLAMRFAILIATMNCRLHLVRRSQRSLWEA